MKRQGRAYSVRIWFLFAFILVGTSALPSFAATLYYNEFYNHTVKRMNLANNAVTTLLTGSAGNVATASFPQSITIDPVNKKILWVNAAETSVNTTRVTFMRSDPNGANITTLGSMGSLQAPNGTGGVMSGTVQPDPTNGKVYWGATNVWEIAQSKIQRANLADGSAVTDLIPNDNIATIALDVPGNKIYWATGYNTTTTTEIRKANLDGTGITTLISNPYTTNYYWGVVLDVVNSPNQIYFSDYNTMSIFKMNMDGTNKQTVVSGLANNVYDLALDTQNRVIYFDTDTGLAKINYDGTGLSTLATGFYGAGVVYYKFPSAPAATAATSVLATSFSANWGAVSGASGYLLDVSTDSSFGSFVAGYNGKDVGNVTTSSVTGLSGATLYHYRVRAYDALDPYGGSASGTIDVTTSALNIAPTFVGATTTLTVNRNASATDIRGLLHVSDSDSSQTETWTQSVAPDHGGALSFSGATASSGGTDITPGGTITYTPANGYSGTETFTVQVSDAIASATRQITVTVVAPPTTTVSTATLSADTGTSGSDWITKTASQTISGTLSANLGAGEKVAVSYDGGSTWADATTSTVGSSSWSTSATLSGSSTFEARVYNSAGSSLAWTQTYTLDTTAPIVVFSGLAFSADTGTSSTDFITRTAAQTISSTLSGAPAGADVVYGSLDNGATWSDITVKVTGTTLSWNGVTLTGSNTLKLKVTDNAGNDGAIAGQAYALDQTAPTNTIATQAFSADTGVSSTDFITKTAAQAVSGTLVANLAAGEFVEVSLDNGSTWMTAGASVGTNTWSLSGQTLTSSNTLHVRVSDTAGNNGAASTQAYVLDQAAPTTTIATAALSADTGTSSTDFITKTAAQTISGSMSAMLAAGELVEVSLDNGSTWATATATVGLNTWSLAGQTLPGSNTLKVRVSDTAGNSGTAFSQAYVLDSAAPTTTIATVAFSSDTGSSNTDFITKTAAQTISGTTSANVLAGEMVEVSLDNGSTWETATSSVGTNTWSLSGQTLTGSNTLKVRVSDTAGNSGTAASQAYVLDTTAPTTTIATAAFSADTGTSSSDFITGTAAQTVSGTASAAILAGEIVEVSLDNGSTWTVATTSVGADTWSRSGQTLAGSNTLRVRVSDTAGNSGTVFSQAYVLDTTAPTITFSAVAFSADTGASSTDFITRTAAQTINAALSGTPAGTDIVHGSLDNGSTWTDITSKVSGTTLSWNGVTLAASSTLKLKVTDNAGNDGTMASQAYTLDTTAPTVTSVAVPTGATYATGQNLDFTINWSESVTVGGPPRIALVIGSSTVYATSLSGSGTSATLFRYTVQSGDIDTNGIAVGSLGLNGGSIADAAGNDATLTLNSVGSTTAVLVDTLIPEATAATSVGATSFSANWDGAAGATGYRLDVSASNTFASFVTGYHDLDMGNGETCNVIGLDAGTNYYYRVRAYSGGDVSGNSNVITVLTRPAAPVATAASSITFFGLTANWLSVMSATGYSLDVATDSSFTSPVAGFDNLDVGNVVAKAIIGLDSGTPYYYRVRAYNTSGPGADSNTVNPTTATTRIVTTIGDSGPGSLRQIITDANPGDAITFDPGLNGLTIVAASPLVIGKDLTISGPGAASLSLSGGGTVQLFQVTGATGFTLQNLTLANGSAVNGGALVDNPAATTAISGCIFSANSATGGGGAIYATGTITINDTLLNGNSATDEGGALFNNNATLSLANVTLHGNSAGGGGGLYQALGSSTLVNTTIAGNSAAVQGGGLLIASGTLNLKNGIVANDIAPIGTDIMGTITSLGYNLIRTTTGATIGGIATGNLTGQDPKLGILATNGGPTGTMALLSGSPAIDAGTCTGAPVADQRGMTRPQDALCDIGAYERGALPSAITATGGTPQSAVINAAFGTALTAKVTDSLGGVLDGVGVTFSGPGSGAGIAAGGSVNTDTAGSASFTATANGTAGSYAVTAAVDTLTATFTLTNDKKVQTITFDNPGNKIFGTAPTLTASASSGLTPTFASSTSGVCTITAGGVLTFVATGPCTIDADQAGDAWHQPADRVSQSFTVEKATATVALGSLSATYDGTAKPATATTDPVGLTTTFTYDGVATVPIHAGSYAVVATVSDANYQGTASDTLVIGKAEQTIGTISFVPATLAVGGTTTASAAATSGLSVSFASVTSAVCTVSGATVRGETVGACTVTANQGGDSDYEPAPEVQTTLSVFMQPTYVLWSNSDTGQSTRWMVDPATASMRGWDWISTPSGVGEAGWLATDYVRVDATTDYILWTNSNKGTAIRWKIDPTFSLPAGGGERVTGWDYISPITGVGAGWFASSYARVDATTDYVLWTKTETGQAVRWKVDPATAEMTDWDWISPPSGVGGGWFASSYVRVDAATDYVLWTNASTGQATRWKVDPATAEITGWDWVSAPSGAGVGWQARSYAREDVTTDYVLWANSATGQALRWAVNPVSAAMTSWYWVSPPAGVGAGWLASSYLGGGALAADAPPQDAADSMGRR